MGFHSRGRLVQRKAGEWSSALGGSRRRQWKSGDRSRQFRRARAEGDGSGSCHMGWRRPCAAWIGEYGGGGGGSTVGRALLAGNGLGARGVGALPFYSRRRRERVFWGRHSRRKRQPGQLSRGRCVAQELGNGRRRGERTDGGGTWRAQMVPRGGGFGKTRGARGGLGLGLGTCPPRWPAPAYGVAGGRGAGRRRWKKRSVAVS